MKFNSVKEYFSKLQSTSYQLMMIPLILFTLYYAKIGTNLLERIFFSDEFKNVLTGTVSIGCFACLTTVHLATSRRIKKISEEVGLGIKLEKIGDVILYRMKWIAAMALIVSLSLYFGKDDRLSILFGAIFLWFFIQWPSPRRVASSLRLKGDEREMVRSKGDSFS